MTDRLPFKRIDPDAVLPGRAHPGDAGLDLRSAVDVEVGPGERAMVPTGLAVAIPEGHAGLVLPRSGLASRQGLTLANAPGLIDAGYRGEVICAVVNLDPWNTQTGWLALDPRDLGIEEDQPFQMHDLLTDQRFIWRGRHHYILLDPYRLPAHVLSVRRRLRDERDFDYFQ